MTILIDNKKISNYTIIDDGMNTLGYENLDEVFFDVFEIRSKGFDLVKERKGDFNGCPIIEVDLQIQDEIFKNVRFALTKESKISINPKLLDYSNVVVFEKKNNKPKQDKKPVTPSKKVKIIKEKVIVKEQPIIQEQTLVNKTKKEFLESVRSDIIEDLKNEIKAGIISDLIRDNVQSNFENVITNEGNKSVLDKIFENHETKLRREYIELAQKIAKREAMRYSESGGGSNATQYANGGSIEGELNITGNLIVNDQQFIKRVIFNVGDGVQQSFTFTHDLNSKDILVNVQDTTTNELVIPYIKLIDDNTITIEFTFIPDINNYKLIIFG